MNTRIGVMKAVIVVLLLMVLFVSCTTLMPKVTPPPALSPSPLVVSTITPTSAPADSVPLTVPLPATPPTMSPTPTLIPTLKAGIFREIGHVGRGTLHSAAWSPDGEVLAISGSFGVHLYDTQTMQEIGFIKGTREIGKIAFSPDGQKIAAAGDFYPSFMEVWEVETGQRVLEIGDRNGPFNNINDFAFTPDGTTLVVLDTQGSYDTGYISTIKLYNTADGSLQRTMGKGLDSMEFFTINPDGTLLAVVGEDDKIYLWDMEKGKMLRALMGHAGSIKDLAFSYDGAQLASVSADATVRLWDPASGRLVRIIQGFSDNVVSVDFLPDGKSLALGVSQEAPQVWDILSGQPIHQVGEKAELILALSPDGQFFATSRLTELRLWNVETRELIYTLGNFQVPHSHLSAVSLDGKILATDGGEEDDSYIQLWDIVKNESLAVFEMRTNYGVNGLALSPDGRLVAAVDDETGVFLWDASTRQGQRVLERGDSLAFSPDGQYLAVSSGGAIFILDALKGSVTNTINGLGGVASLLSFSPDGKQITSVINLSQSIHVWDSMTGDLLHQFNAPSEQVFWNRYDLNGHYFARNITQYEDFESYDYIELWDITADKLVGNLSIPDNANDLLFSLDGRLLLILSDSKLIFWDTVTGEVIYQDGRQDWDSCPLITLDGRLAVAGNSIWDVSAITDYAARLPIPAVIPLPTRVPIRGTVTPALMPMILTPIALPSTAPGAIAVENVDSITKIMRLGNGTIEQAVWSPDGKTLALAGSLGITMYDAENLSEFQHIATGGWAYGLAFSPDGKQITTGSPNGQIQVWDVATREQLHTFQGCEDLKYVVFSPDGNRIASEGSENTLRIWDLGTGQVAATLRGYRGGEYQYSLFAFSPDGRTLAAPDQDGGVRMWDTTTGQVMNTLRGLGSDAVSIAFNPDGLSLAIGGKLGSVSIMNLSTDQLAYTLTVKLIGMYDSSYTDYTVNSVAYSPNGRYLAAASGTMVRLFNTYSRELLYELTNHQSRVTTLAFSPDGNKLLTLDEDSALMIWETKTGQLLKSPTGFGDDYNGISFADDGNLHAWNDQMLWWFDPSNGDIINSYSGYNGQILSVGSDGQLAAIYDHYGETESGWNGLMRLWDVEPSQVVYELEGSPMDWMFGAPGYFRSAAFSPDNEWLVGGGNGGLWLWSVSSGMLEDRLDGFLTYVVVFSPNGQYIAADGYQNVMLWDITRGKLLRELTTGLEESFQDIAFSPDGLSLVGASHNGVYLWDIASAEVIKSLPLLEFGGASLAYSPDGNLLAVGDWDGSVYLLDSATFEILIRLKGHAASVDHLTFSADGRLLASASSDGTILMWGLPR